MIDHATSVTGGCLCGAVRFEARAFLASAAACHCGICRKSSGQPADVSVPIEPGTLRFTRGGPATYRSSPQGERGFCAVCGARLFWRPLDPADEWLTNFTVGSLDDASAVAVSHHQFVDRKLPLTEIDPRLPRFREDEAAAAVEFWATRIRKS